MSHIVKGRRRVQIKQNGKYVADKLFPKGVSKDDIDQWVMRVKLGLIDPLRESSCPNFEEFVETFKTVVADGFIKIVEGKYGNFPVWQFY